MLEFYIFINGMYNMLKNLVDYGLFPTPSKECQHFAPTLTKMFQYSNKYTGTVDLASTLEHFKTIHTFLEISNKLSEKTKHICTIKSFSPDQLTSNWILFNLSYIYHVLNKACLDDFPLFEYGNYLPVSSANKRAPFDNNHLMHKTVGKRPHRISQINDLQIIDMSRSPVVVFRREFLAYCMFNFMEVRNVYSLDYNVYLSF